MSTTQIKKSCGSKRNTLIPLGIAFEKTRVLSHLFFFFFVQKWTGDMGKQIFSETETHVWYPDSWKVSPIYEKLERQKQYTAEGKEAG